MHAAERYISRNPTVRGALAMGLVNYSKLARAISADSGGKSFDAVLAACRRISARLERGKSVADLLKKSKKTIQVSGKSAKIRIDIDIRKDELSEAVELLG